jgi:hypothetical protein
MTKVFEDGVLVGWFAEAHIDASGKPRRVFIPRREEDVEADRIALDPEHPANWE